MAQIKRFGRAVWRGDLKSGKGTVSNESGALSDVPYTFGTRFGDERGANPEELIAAAHAACYSMAFSNFLAGKGHRPEEIQTKATCMLTSKNGGFAITGMKLEVKGRVPGLDQQAFSALAHEADGACPVSNLLRPGLEIEIEAELVVSS